MNLMIVPGMFVCSSFLISVCMFIVSKALLISSATVIVRAEGAISLNPFATWMCCCCLPHPSNEKWWRGPTTVSTHTGRWYPPSSRNSGPLVDWWPPPFNHQVPQLHGRRPQICDLWVCAYVGAADQVCCVWF